MMKAWSAFVAFVIVMIVMAAQAVQHYHDQLTIRNLQAQLDWWQCKGAYREQPSGPTPLEP